MKKSEHAQFLKLLDECLVGELGAEKIVSREASKACRAPQLFSYKFNTTYGALMLTPDVPWPLAGERVRYDCTVYGRFAGPIFPADANQHSGKWNFHFGPRNANELDSVVTDVAQRVSRILVPTVGKRDNIREAEVRKSSHPKFKDRRRIQKTLFPHRLLTL